MLVVLIIFIVLAFTYFLFNKYKVFQPDPSIRDIENQSNYQTLFRDNATSIDPFVGLIIGPYDIRIPTEESIFSKIKYFKLKISYLFHFTIRLVSSEKFIRRKKLSYVRRT